MAFANINGVLCVPRLWVEVAVNVFQPTNERDSASQPSMCLQVSTAPLPACLPQFSPLTSYFFRFRHRPVAARMAHPGSLPPNGRAPQQQVVDPFADWESMFESGELDASLKNLDLSKPPPPLPGQQAAMPPRVILQEQEEGRSEYQPPEPKMTIMKRPDSSSSSNAKAAADLKHKKSQQKSLKQREQEYAEARQRILGSLGAAEEAKQQQQQQQQTPQQHQQHVRVVAAPSVKQGGRGGMRGVPIHGPRYPETATAPPPSNPIPSMPPSRPVAPYSAQRQFRVPPPHIVSIGGPSPLEIATRSPRGPPPEGGRGFPPTRR